MPTCDGGKYQSYPVFDKTIGGISGKGIVVMLCLECLFEVLEILGWSSS